MKPTSISPRSLVRTAVLCAALGLTSAAAYAQSAPFAGMAGVWSGNGTISLEDGSKERIRCKATYAVSGDGTGLNQSLLCASDSYKFELKSDVKSRGGELSGNWAETTRGVTGSLEGRASAGRFNVDVSSPAFSAKLILTTTGNKQQVSITSEGQFRGASISLNRS
ncbi:hypothetical protein [Tardiphaga sp.]|uniref:hypothetical protein n=1 Tax=Tardiphaga sp. TaxID=1926292 RepID=UPI00352A8DB2